MLLPEGFCHSSREETKAAMASFGTPLQNLPEAILYFYYFFNNMVYYCVSCIAASAIFPVVLFIPVPLPTPEHYDIIGRQEVSVPL